MENNIKENGLTENNMDKELKLILKELKEEENGKMELEQNG